MRDDHSADNQPNNETHVKKERTFWGDRLNDKIKAGDAAKLLLVPILSSFLIQFVRFQIQSWSKVPATPSPPASTSRPRVFLEAPLKALLPPTIRPRLADNGSSFPTKSDYIRGYPRQHQGGYSSITVDNAQNNYDVFVTGAIADLQKATTWFQAAENTENFTVIRNLLRGLQQSLKIVNPLSEHTNNVEKFCHEI